MNGACVWFCFRLSGGRTNSNTIVESQKLGRYGRRADRIPDKSDFFFLEMASPVGKEPAMHLLVPDCNAGADLSESGRDDAAIVIQEHKVIAEV